MTTSTGRYFDGETGLQLTVNLDAQINAGRLVLMHPDLPGGQSAWPLEDMRAQPDGARADQITLSLRADTSDDSALVGTARLVIVDPDMRRLLAKHCPALFRRDVQKGTGFKVLSRIGLAVGALAMMVFVIIPAMSDTLARLIPVDREVRWGKSVVAQIERVFGGTEIGSLRCTGADGQAALEAMLLRLTDGTETAYDHDVQVFNHPMINAFAAPGGQIVIMRGLIQKAKSADEVAAVLAHEIGHVESRDVTRNALRVAGSAGLLSLVLGDFAGGSIAVLVADTVLNAAYTREAETAADLYAHAMLDRASISATGMADFFDTLSDVEGAIKLPEYFASHPATDSRADAARVFADAQARTTPVLTDAQWADLRGICARPRSIFRQRVQ